MSLLLLGRQRVTHLVVGIFHTKSFALPNDVLALLVPGQLALCRWRRRRLIGALWLQRTRGRCGRTRQDRIHVRCGARRFRGARQRVGNFARGLPTLADETAAASVTELSDARLCGHSQQHGGRCDGECGYRGVEGFHGASFNRVAWVFLC